MLRPTWAEVDLDAISWNVRQFKSLVGEHVKVLVAVKADAYGHGAVPVARTAIAAGAEYLGVATVQEGMELRSAGIDTPILILGYVPVEAADLIVQNDLSQAVYQAELVSALAKAAEDQRKRVKVHIKVDTGMSRIGIMNPNDVVELATRILQSPYLELEGIFSHLSRADEVDKTYTFAQYERWLRFISALEQAGISIPIQHIANSAAAIDLPEFHLQMVRIGIGAYGCYPSSEVKRENVKLRQALHLYSKIVRIEQLPPEYQVGYGGTFSCAEAARTCRIATVPIGYADGYSRLLSNQGTVIVRGQRVPVAGRVSMDQLMLDVSEIESAQVGDTVCLYGRMGDQWISLDEVAEKIGTISYEVSCALGKRVPRIYRAHPPETMV
ncbi:alanine racemase [Fodinisporobacter ferrooxydans]|uniref:Alanine racemase n=1 Tax=Fodinisporobacter ferrooxydans TaxID=2901836 RepID=A0ABY4CT22_9BACL|nr:alanine racemase [Alicyclobacillaceae bacterium MYW30-H2]